MKFKEYMNEKKSDYVIYHKSYTNAVTEIENFVKKNGFTLDDETDKEDIGTQMFNLVGSGHSKPTNGKTNRFNFDLYKKLLHCERFEVLSIS